MPWLQGRPLAAHIHRAFRRFHTGVFGSGRAEIQSDLRASREHWDDTMESSEDIKLRLRGSCRSQSMSREGLSKTTLDRDSSEYEELERSDDLQNMYGCVYVYVNVYV